MKCHKCGNSKIKEEDNFCVACGAKLKKTCKCWVLKKDNYDCGESSCPGYKILIKIGEKMKHKVGDKVKVREDLKTNVDYGVTIAVEEMCTFSGDSVTINEVDTEEEYYFIKEDEGYFCWTDEMFEDAVTNADKIRNMSDEELAEFLINVVRHKVCNYISEDVCHGNKCEFCEGFLWWLQQPTNL